MSIFSKGKEKSAFFGSISSELAYNCARDLIKKGWKVSGTYRVKSDLTKSLTELGVELFYYDFNNQDSLKSLLKNKDFAKNWDLLMVSPSILGKTGSFGEINWKDWNYTFNLNFLSQVNFIHQLLDRRSKNGFPYLWLWSGPGTNNAPKEQSAVIVAKIAQIKFVEILNEEYDDLIPIIVGPGWVNTKTHKEVISMGPKAGYKYYQTKERIDSGSFTSMEKIIQFFNWVIKQEKNVVGGRNFSIRSDIWEHDNLLKDYLNKEYDAFKLRRFMNDWRPEHVSDTNFKPKDV